MSKTTVIATWVVGLIALISSMFLYNYYNHIGHWSSGAWIATCTILTVIQVILTPFSLIELLTSTKES